MRKGLLYIPGKGGAANEAARYRPLFPDWDVVGMDYRADTPWDAQEEFCRFYDRFSASHERIILIANSIGAFFAMSALSEKRIEKSYFISPIVDMERLITDRMQQAGISERELMERGAIDVGAEERLSWQYLSWVREHPVSWRAPTAVLYGAQDRLQSLRTIRAFAAEIGADLTVMEDGEHWFHTPAQLAFLDAWIQN